jgi:hypothetical protein
MQAACKDAWSFELDGNDVDPVKMPEKPAPAPSVTVIVTPTPAPDQKYTCSSLEVWLHGCFITPMLADCQPFHISKTQKEPLRLGCT